MTEEQVLQLFKCLADATRLQLLSALGDGPKYVELLSQLLDRSPSTVSFHLKKLEEAGLVEAKKEQYYTMYRLNRSLLDAPIGRLVLGDPKKLDAQAVKEQQYRESVLKNLFEYGKLKNIPVQRKKRRLVLVKLAEKLPFFPKIINERSMLYVENLAEFIRLLVESGRGGLFFPQNPEYVTTSQMVRTIGEVKGKKIRLWSILNPLVKLAAAMPGKIGGMANKAFGSLTIDRALSDNEFAGYQMYSLQESVKKSI